LPLFRILQYITEKLLGKCVQDIKTVPRLLLDFYFRTEFSFLNLHVIAVGKPLQGFDIRKFLMLHEKTDGIAAAPATKTFINFLCRGNRKRGCLFIMKRTEAQVISASFFQFYKPADDLCNVDPAQYLLYGLR
jgi:hypothetical protein